MKADPKYSIIITAYNRKEYIKAAFKSAVSQDYSGSYEIIVVSNFVDENIKAESLKNPSFVKYILDESESWGKMLVNGILSARGEWICLLDDDDLFCENKLSEIDSILCNTKNVGIIKNPVSPINSMGNKIPYPNPQELLFSLLNPISGLPKLRKEEHDIYYRIIPVQSNYFDFSASFTNNSSLTINRRMLLNYLDILKHIAIVPESFFLSLALSEKLDMIITKEVLGKYRIHLNNTSIIIDPIASLNTLKKYVSDFKTASSLPIQNGFRNALRSISSRLQILYVYRMYMSGQLSFKQILKPRLITTILYGVFGRPEKRIFLLPFRFFKIILKNLGIKKIRKA